MTDTKRYLLLTLFPEVVPGPCGIGVVGRAAESGLLSFSALNLREYGEGKHRIVDDTPYGGGDGMVMKADPLVRAIDDARAMMPEGSPVILMSPRGEPFRQKIAHELAELPGLIMLCGRYEGIDERVRTHYVDRELSMGDFVLSGGEAAALTMLDAVSRLVPGVLGNAESIKEESFQRPFLEYPQYTRPADFRGLPIPEILISGHHENIRRWRLQESIRQTLLHRPDLLEDVELTREESKILAKVKQQLEEEDANKTS
ncbi:MAG: tRNA (guanosine(37)-N1)-methyltransferase TrmD [Myxococcales bacterium]|nr:tRNA (guanosine(37)-N1)-methyltransferase TrmD [Myxococcales bacterium]